MFWNKKKSKGLPDLPSPGIPSPKGSNNSSVGALPAFPDAPSQKGFSQSMIKEAVEPEEIISPHLEKATGPKKVTKEIGDKTELPPIPGSLVTKKPIPLKEHHKEKSIITSPKKEIVESKINEIGEWKPQEFKSMENPETFSKKPMGKNLVFVRLDKFNDARESLEEIKGKLEEIDEMLKTLKDVKVKEEEELTNWEKEMMELKVHLNSLMSDVFEDAEK